jgi:hypothetical protein
MDTQRQQVELELEQARAKDAVDELQTMLDNAKNHLMFTESELNRYLSDNGDYKAFENERCECGGKIVFIRKMWGLWYATCSNCYDKTEMAGQGKTMSDALANYRKRYSQ